jgi:hypothetical protein
VIYFVVLGIGFGIAPLLMFLGSGKGRQWAAFFTGFACGACFGALAFFASSALRRWLNTGVALPMLGHAGESLSGDILVFVLASILITLPAFAGLLMLGSAEVRAKSVTIPLAAIVSGLLFPITASFLMPEQSTKDFPPIGPSLLALWLALLAPLIILFMTTTGEKQRAKPTGVEVQPEA